MNLIRPILILVLLKSNVVAAQDCRPIPEKIGSLEGCSIHTQMDHLAVKILDIEERESVIQVINSAMEQYGILNLSENIYWYPEGRSCYLSWYGIESDYFVLVQSIRNIVVDQVWYCDIEMGRYDSASLTTVIEQELEKVGLQNSVSIDLANIEVDTRIYDEILRNGGTPSLMTVDGEIITIDMQD